jgi:hypothetical protein
MSLASTKFLEITETPGSYIFKYLGVVEITVYKTPSNICVLKHFALLVGCNKPARITFPANYHQNTTHTMVYRNNIFTHSSILHNSDIGSILKLEINANQKSNLCHAINML